MPPVAIVVGPRDTPVGENGCLASATRRRPSPPAYFCACASAGGDHDNIIAATSAPMSERIVPPRRGPGDGCRRRFGREILARIDESIALEAILLVVQLPVAPVRRQQLVVVAALDDLASLEHEDLIRASNRGQPVRDHE